MRTESADDGSESASESFHTPREEDLEDGSFSSANSTPRDWSLPSSPSRGEASNQTLRARIGSARADLSQSRLANQKLVVRLELEPPETSFGLILSDCLRVVEICPETPAARSGLQVLDLVVAIDGARASSISIHDTIAGKTALSLTIERLAPDAMCETARNEQLSEWTLWERAVVACALGASNEAMIAVDALFHAGIAVESRTLSSLEACAFTSAHRAELVAVGGSRLNGGQGLAQVAEAHGHEALAERLEMELFEADDDLDHPIGLPTDLPTNDDLAAPLSRLAMRESSLPEGGGSGDGDDDEDTSSPVRRPRPSEVDLPGRVVHTDTTNDDSADAEGADGADVEPLSPLRAPSLHSNWLIGRRSSSRADSRDSRDSRSSGASFSSWPEDVDPNLTS